MTQVGPTGPQFRQVKPIVGTFLLLTLLVVLGLTIVTARTKRWFQRVTPLEIHLPNEGSFGLRPGSDVEMLGAVVGSVDDVWIDDKTDRMHARLTIETAFLRFVRRDSRCVIRRKALGLVGDAYLEITRGTKEPALPGVAFESEVDRGPTELLQEVSAELVPAIRAARDVTAKFGELAQLLTDPQGRLQQALHRVDRLLAACERTDSIAGRLLNDKQWAEEAQKTLTSLHASIEKTQKNVDDVVAAIKTLTSDGRATLARAGTVLESTQASAERLPVVLDDTKALLGQLRQLLDRLLQASSALPDLVGVVRDESKSLGGVVVQSRKMLYEMEQLVMALQNHWFIRGYIEPSPKTERLSPSELGGADGKR